MKKKKAIEFIEEAFCDRCEEKISDGMHDGGGGVNFWGAYVNLLKSGNSTTEFSLEGPLSNSNLLMRVRMNWHTIETFELCANCASEIIQFVKDGKQDTTRGGYK